MADTGHLGMTLLTAGQSGGETSVNASLSRLDALAQILVMDNDLDSPAALTPVAGDTYILSAAGSDGWVTFAENSIAWYDGGTWFNLLPTSKHEGLLAYIQDENSLFYWTGSAWAELPGGDPTESISGHITSPFVKTYVLDEYAEYGYTVNEIRARVGTGTSVTLSLTIGGTEITGIDSVIIITTQTNSMALALNVVPVSGKLELVVESLSGTPADLSFTIKTTRS